MQIHFTFATTSFLVLIHCSSHVHAFTPQIRPAARRTIRNVHLQSSINDDDQDEWRAYRAKLVQNGLPTIDNISDPSQSDSKSNVLRYAYTTTPLIETGSILISIPTRDLCQAIDQQYWHRSVAIITHISENVVSGSEEDTVPQEQLAHGDGRGRWSYRGLLLNRCTNLFLGENDCDGHPTTTQCTENNGNEWRIQRGGDLLGLESSSGTDFVCLHNFGTSDAKIASVSTKVVGNLCQISIRDAQKLCRDYPEDYNPLDFMTFGGFCSWRPGQLEREMGHERNEWLVLSVDGATIWDELRSQQDELTNIDKNKVEGNGVQMLEAGTAMWRQYLKLINVSESKATECVPLGQLDFYDQMLKVWAEEYLHCSPSNASTELNDSSNQIGPGALVRAKCPPTNDMLLYDAEFIRSLILVLEDTPESTVGVILNHPMSAAVEFVEGKDVLPLRYGGPIDVLSWRDGSYRDDGTCSDDDGDDEIYEGFADYQISNDVDELEFDESMDADLDYEDADNDSSFIWIHRDAKIEGTQLGSTSLWLIEEHDALEALQSGLLSLNDVMVFAGVCIWEKGENLGRCNGGLREQIDALGSLEVVQGWNDAQLSHERNLKRVWGILTLRQQVLTRETLDTNINAAIDAWISCSENTKTENDPRTKLSDSALKAWVAIDLLEEPLETLVVVNP